MSRAATLAVFGLGGCLMTAAADTKSVQFVAIVPDANAQQADHIYLACSRDGWEAAGRKVPRVAPGVYSASLSFESGLLLEYKFTRAGTWESVEKADDGHDVPNRLVMIDPLLDEQVVVSAIGSWGDRAVSNRRKVELVAPGGSAPPRPTSTLTGDIRYHYRFHSPQLKNERTVIVYLPPAYDSHPKDRYPVLYMHDGNNVFDAGTAFAGVEWGADETAQRLIEAHKIPPLIIVGIYNTPARIDEYTPFADKRRRGGKGDEYLAFLVDTVKPFIDKTYRTRPGPEDTGICGSSLGGLISLYAVFARPDVFGKAAAVSPTLGWADRTVFDYVRAHPPQHRPRLWLDVGTAEGETVPQIESSAFVTTCDDMSALLGELGFASGRDLHFEKVENGRHNEAAWAKRFDRILQFLYPVR